MLILFFSTRFYSLIFDPLPSLFLNQRSNLHLTEVGVRFGLLAGAVVEPVVHQARRGGVGVAVHVHLLLSVHVEVAGALVLVAVGAAVAALGAGVWQRIIGVVA